MNNSGECIAEMARYYKIDPSHIIVIYDDISLPTGSLRIRTKGSAGGHNGIKSIIQHLGSETFCRVRMGVGMKPPKMDLADHVLGHFMESDQPMLKEAMKDAKEAINLIMAGDTDKAMNLYNKKVKNNN